MENDSSTSTKPVKTFRYRGISASIFENHTDQGELFHKVQVVRNYKTEDGFAATSTFTRSDLPVVIHVSQQAFEFVLTAENTAREVAKAKKSDK